MSDPSHELPTSLGPPLRLQGGVWGLDLTELPILHGLSVLSRALAEMVVAEARTGRLDVTVERRLRSREHPELVEQFRLQVVRLAVEPTVLDAIAAAPEALERRLRALLGSLQRQSFREALLPRNGQRAIALVAEFEPGAARQRFVLEHLVARHSGDRGALWITIEGLSGRRLDLTAMPHTVISDIADRMFIAGSTRIAQTWAEALRREAERGRRSFTEQRSPHNHLFRQLDQAGLAMLQRVSLQWSEAAQSFLLESDPAGVSELLKRVLLAGEDRHVRELLGSRQIVRIDAGPLPVYLDLAQLGRVLELSLGQPRHRLGTAAFLQRMPALSAFCAGRAAQTPFAGVRIFLVHHMTAEVVGLIDALRQLGCRDLTVLFVTYAGDPPASYLDAVLDLPPDEFRALALVNVPTRGHVEGNYRLSTHYSQLDEAPAITAALADRSGDYLAAMRAAAVVPFLRQAARAEAAGERQLLIEDGGYLGPVVQDALLRGIGATAFAVELGHAHADNRPLRQAIGERLIATVEHTRNGFDRLAEVETRHGSLALPAYSIAISHHKRVVEAREVAASILNAVESVLHADGRILARRRCLVLGSRGAIGSELVRSLRGRLADDSTHLTGIDLRARADDSVLACEERTLAELPGERWLHTDLVLGVTGTSVLTAADIENWLHAATPDTLTLVSGSTKKVEFRSVMRWFDEISRSREPRVCGRAVTITIEELLDPWTSRLYGHRWRCQFADDGRVRTILALAQLTPINFLFYGVATELIDEVLTQLASLAVGAVGNGHSPVGPWRLLAVDRDVDADARPLH